MSTARWAGRVLGWKLAGAVLALAAMPQCRTADKPGVSEIDATDKTWYDQAGAVQSCDNTAANCTVYKDQKTFIDTCVAKGFQAKTCGCLVVCSGKIPGFSVIDEASGKKSGGAQADTCVAANKTAIAAVAKARVAGSSLDRCVTSHVCKGNLGLCSGGDQSTSTHMRALARQGCSMAVVDSLCPEGFDETFACPETLIQSLSQTLLEFQNKDSSAKRCIRGLICSDSGSGCDPVSAKRGASLKQAINHDGCEYWLRAFCAMGTKAW